MSYKRILAVLTETVLVICLPLALLLGSVDAIASRAYVRHEYGLRTFPPSELYPAEERLRLAEASVHYLRSPEDSTYLGELRYNGVPVYNEREIQHLVDVKIVTGAVFTVEIVALVAICASLLYLLWTGQSGTRTLRGVVSGCVLLWGLGLIVAVTAVVNFDQFFTQFHRVFFADGTWTFPVTDTLIQLFPIRFWIDTTWKLGALALGSAALLGGISYALLRRNSAR